MIYSLLLLIIIKILINSDVIRNTKLSMYLRRKNGSTVRAYVKEKVLGLPCLQIVDFLWCDESFPESEKQMLFTHTSLFASVHRSRTKRRTRMPARCSDMIFRLLLPTLWQMHSNRNYLLEKNEDWTFSYYLIFIIAVFYVSVPSNSSDGHMQADGWQEKMQTRQADTTCAVYIFLPVYKENRNS